MNQPPPPWQPESPQVPFPSQQSWQQQPFQQPHTSYPPQQPMYPQQAFPSLHTYYPQQSPYQPPMQPPPPQPLKKKHGPLFWILLSIGGILGLVLGSAIINTISQTTSTPVLSESAYKDSATFTTVADLDKDGNSDQGKQVHFTCKILGFVKDSTGNTAGANVGPSNTSFGSVVQIGFPPGTDLSQLNVNDTVEVWGTDDGVSSGQNAFGGTVQEVGITAQYITDQTTNYQQ